jgi:SLT domain-containing protein
MTLTITIANDTDATRLVNDFCDGTQYDAGSGLTKAQWIKARIVDYVRQMAKRGDYKTGAATISGQIDAIVVT